MTAQGGEGGCSPLASEAWELLLRFASSQLHRHLAQAVAGLELSQPQAYALRALRPGEPLPMKQLAACLRCDASNVTGIVDRLEAAGLVERRVDPRDRRVKALVVTVQGALVRERLLDRLGQPPGPIVALPPDEQRLLRDVLVRMLAEPGGQRGAPGRSGRRDRIEADQAPE